MRIGSKTVAATRAAWKSSHPVKSALNHSAVSKGFEYLGTPSIRGAFGRRAGLTSEQLVRSGKRRAIGIGSVLGANALIGPSGSRSTGRSGSLSPRSTGGYA